MPAEISKHLVKGTLKLNKPNPNFIIKNVCGTDISTATYHGIECTFLRLRLFFIPYFIDHLTLYNNFAIEKDNPA